MRAWAFVLAVLCLAGVVHPGSAAAQDVSEVVGLRACNAGGTAIALALSTAISPSDQRFHVFGWYTLRPGCTDIGYFPRPWLYYYAEELNKGRSYKIWQGKFPICVGYPGPFDWVHATGISCNADELKQFTETKVDPTTGILVVTFK
jgi:hypothetical protein